MQARDVTCGEADSEALIADAAALVQVPSVTGDERAALEALTAMAEGLGLRAELRRHDLAALRAHPGHPGEEAARDELWGLTVTRPGGRGAPRLCLNGDVDVVPAGSEEWSRGPWSGAVEDGFLFGRGAVDMKGAVVAALHAMATASPPQCEVVLQAVASEEDGGLGTFAALSIDDRFDACLVVEPTAFAVVCAQAGALTFTGEVRGRAAHAATRLEGRSAIDAYGRALRTARDGARPPLRRAGPRGLRRRRRTAGPAGGGTVRCGHAPLLRARYPVRDGRNAGHRARPRGRRARGGGGPHPPLSLDRLAHRALRRRF